MAMSQDGARSALQSVQLAFGQTEWKRTRGMAPGIRKILASSKIRIAIGVYEELCGHSPLGCSMTGTHHQC